MSENEPSAAKASSEDDDDNKNITLPKSVDTSYEMDNLEERFSQQQVMISQLKEMVLAEETARTEKIANTRLKMEKYVSQLAKIRDRAKHKQKIPPSTSKVSDSVEKSTSIEESRSTDLSITPTPDNRASESESASQSNIISPKPSDIASEKPKLPNREVTKLLHQQIKERKAMIAERTKNEKELEKALMKIQKQLDESQSQSAEILQVGQSKLTSNIPLILNENVDTNKTIIELRSKINHLEGNILDLQETCKEKDNVIRSKTEAITLMSADLSRKGKATLDLLDDTKEQMQKMQENFANMESNMKSDKDALLSELEVYKNKITYLEEANSILESERFKLSIENTGLEDKIAEKEIEITNINCMLQEKIKELDEFSSKLENVPKMDEAEEKGVIEVAEMNQMTEKIEILEKLNNTLRQSNIELQEKLESNADRKSNTPPAEQQAKSSPKSKPKFNKNTYKGAQKSKSFEEEKKNYLDSIKKLESTIETLNKQILEKEILLHQKEVEVDQLKETLKPVESIVEYSQDLVVTESSLPVDQPIEGVSDVVVGDVEDPNNVSLKDQLEDALKQIENLTKDLSEANKNMIKLKATHKTKVKQMQKSIDDYSKVSHSNAEVVRLQSDVNMLTQKVAELEDDKGNLQLHLVDYDSGRVSDSQLHAKLVDVESVAEERLKAIADLEMQKFDLVQELHVVKQKATELEDKMADLTFLENEHVSSEIKYAQLEEQLDALKSDKTNLLQQIENITAERNSLLLDVEAMTKEKSETSNKLDYYIQENMELIDRLEKLSAEKVSSAESIEMVESLTSQEKLEIEHFQKSYSVQQHEKESEETKEEDTFSKSDTDKANLLNKIDLYSQERDKVIDKLESLQAAHNEISLRLEELTNEKKLLEEQYDFVKKEKDDVCIELKTNEEKIVQLGNKIEELSNENSSLSEKLSQLSTPVRTEEVIVSETIEVEDTIEKEFIEYPIKAEVSEATVESKPIELVEETSKPAKSSQKGDKKFTKEILRLKNTLKHKETEISDLNVKLSELSEMIKNNEELVSNNTHLSTKMQELMDENSSLNNQIIQFNSERDVYDASVKDLQQFNAELLKSKDTLAENMSVIESKDLEILSLKQNIVQKEETFNTCNAKLISELENKISCLQIVIDQNNCNVSDLHSELYESFDNSDKLNYLMERLQTRTASLVGCLDNKQLEIVAITNEKSDLVDKMLKLQLQCSEKDEIINSIKQQLLESSENFDDHSHESLVSKLNERFAAYVAEEARLTQCYNSLEKTYSTQCTEFADAKNNLKNKSDMCDKMKTVIEKLKDKLKAEIQRCKDLDDGIKALKSQYSDLETKYNCIHADLQQSSALEHTVTQLQMQIKELSSQNENAIVSVQYTQKNNDDLVSQIEGLHAKISQYELQFEQSRQENESYLRTIQEMKVEIKNNESALSKIAELEEQLLAKQEEVQTLIRQSEELGNTYNETTSAHEAKIQEREVYIESLEIDLNKCKEKINRLEENLQMMESLEEKTNSLVTKLQEKDLALSETLQHEDELTKKLTSLAAQDKQLQKQLNEIKHENNELHETIASLNDAKKHLHAELDVFQSELSHVKNSLVDFEVTNQERYTLIERCNVLEGNLKDVSHEYSERLNAKTREFEYLETTLQTQCENYDEQIKQTKEHCKRLQEEIDTHWKTISEATADNERLRNDIENLNSNNSTNIYSPPLFKFEDSNFQQSQIVIGQDVFNLQIEIGNLSSALKERDEFIVRLQNEISSLSSAPQPVLNEEVYMKASQAVSMEASKFFDQLSVDKAPIFDLQSLEDQIVSNNGAKAQNVSNVETSMIRGFCHDPPVAVVQTSTTQTANTSIVDEIIQPKVAFKCFTSEEATDDSHNQKILDLEASMETLTAEKKKLSTDLAQNQLKTNKALLKLKEYKLRYDNLSVEFKKLKSSGATSDLDTAIQEELYSQIAKLEDRLKDVSSNSDKEKMEKDGLQKRIDVLTSSNERLIEMKEKQDLEMGVYKMKNQSLNEKLKNLQWGADFDMDDENSPEDDAKSEAYLETIDELNVKVKGLEIDNEYLQSALSEQENKFELMIQNERQQMSDRKGESLDGFKKENDDLKKSLEEALEAKNNLNSSLESASKENNDLKDELAKSSDMILHNSVQLESFKNENLDLKSKLEALVYEYTEFQEKFHVLLNDKDRLELKHTDVSASIAKLEEENKNITVELTNSRNELSKISYEKQELVDMYDALSANHDEMRRKIELLEEELHQSDTASSTFVSDLSSTRQQLELVSQELTECKSDKCHFELEVKNLQTHLDKIANAKMENLNENDGLHIECLQKYNNLKKEMVDLKYEQEEYGLEVKTQLATEIQKYHVLFEECENLRAALSEKETEKITMNKEVDCMKQQLFDTQTTLVEAHKMMELKDNDLRLFYEKEGSYDSKLGDYNKYCDTMDAELKKHRDEVESLQYQLHEKEVELANMRLKMHDERTHLESTIVELTSKATFFEKQLETKVEECRSLNAKLEELRTLVDEEANQMGEMRPALEAQELEIVTLKENLQAHVEAYDKLSKAYNKSGRHVTFSDDTKFNDDKSLANVNKDDPVSPRADLDLALYMLHQRDVRCEELTVELMSLLEERDTLQLKLSNAIRTNEELRIKAQQPPAEIQIEESLTSRAAPQTSAAPDSPAEHPEEPNLNARTLSETSELDGKESAGSSLENKISELHSVSHFRDIRVKDERESRQRQMELLQRDIQNLPPEAAAQLREAHYTLSRDTQSASTVLFNWLWGRTTPKVVHM
ncbi:lava lamp [Arctopsyche grandis]|uniref:lava lamp n=1 Tax=Arctopsyche grandis TaxID=121162 RepID=UPI00406D6D1D